MGKLIGVFATEISNRVQASLYQEIHRKAKEIGYNLVFFSANAERITNGETDNEARYLFAIAENMDFAAFIIHAQSLANPTIIQSVIDMGKSKDIPVILYDCDNYGFTKDDGIITINLDYKQGFAESVRHLIEHHGLKNIYMLAGMRDNKFSDDRIEMYKKEMSAHGLECGDDRVFYGNFWDLPAIEAVKCMLDSDLPTPEAICCANDSMAIAAVKILEQRGFRVPEDVLVTGFDGIDDGKFNFPVIATCEPVLSVVPDWIFDVIKNDIRTGEYYVPLKFYPKESCGCDNKYAAFDKREMAQLLENGRQNSWQHSMLSNMQLELMDSRSLEAIADYMSGIIRMFKGFQHVFCIRDDVECCTDYTGPFDTMRIYMNLDFLPDKEYSPFSTKEVIPEYDSIIKNAAPDDIFMFRMLQSVQKKYGYSITKAAYFPPNEMKIFGQFSISFTNMMESVLRNMRLEQANQKLSEMYERMSEIYIRDMMTGLYNRTGYYKNLDEYFKRDDIKDGYIHIISIDMDGMKYINDNFGHQEGDIAIKAVARAIDDCFAQPCISARFGGDEFMVALFTETDEKPSQARILERMNNYLENISTLQNKEYSVGVSVGQSVVKISEVTDIKILEKMADDSMYINKRERKARKAVQVR